MNHGSLYVITGDKFNNLLIYTYITMYICYVSQMYSNDVAAGAFI